MKVYLFFVITLNCYYNYAVLADCEIYPHEKNAPLLIKHGSSSFIYPQNGSETVPFADSEVVDLSCPGKKVVLGEKIVDQATVQATCISKSTFKVNEKEYHWSQIKCSAHPLTSVRKTRRKCGYRFMETDIGFQIDENRFVTTYSVCFDNVNQNTLYSFFNLTPAIASYARGVPRPNFYEDKGFYHVGGQPVYKLYTRVGQRTTINKLIGLDYRSTKYVQNGAWYFLARGHLSAKADFVYAAQQDATFKFLNVAPQWQSFNGKNWERVESSTREYAVAHNTYLLVWTGTHDVASLPHEESGEQIKLYLYVDGEKRGIPVPALYWKLIYNPTAKKGVVLIGHNNPYEKNIGKHVICPDVSEKIQWVSWNRTNIKDGYSYACDVESFRKVVKHAPSVYVNGLLV
ncbi:unnamed protein product [Acanthoscelides obtectus]|nr:unnamed protein product [Acanthoscelides obtectus]CAK1642835.1 hypothetical protein AOBTE_LOCUS13234 [Acanthoscelides obtectus]